MPRFDNIPERLLAASSHLRRAGQTASTSEILSWAQLMHDAALKIQALEQGQKQ
jgi:hypothetical protein